jgi:hypothetical protein
MSRIDCFVIVIVIVMPKVSCVGGEARSGVR